MSGRKPPDFCSLKYKPFIMKNVLPLLKSRFWSWVSPPLLLVVSFESPTLAAPRFHHEARAQHQCCNYSTLTPEHFQTMRRIWVSELNAIDIPGLYIGSLLSCDLRHAFISWGFLPQRHTASLLAWYGLRHAFIFWDFLLAHNKCQWATL